MNTINKLIMVGFITGLVVTAVFLFILPTPQSSTSSPTKMGSKVENSVRNILPKPSPKSSPLPFEELTIPYLRERTYKSALGKRTQVAQTSTYTSYLTTYASDDLTIRGLLTQPSGEIPDGGWPAIVFIHGYIPPEQYRTLERYQSYVDYLARNGFVVFKIDLRGHGESEGTANGAYFSSDYIIDTLNARAALAASPFVNGDRVGLWGHSMAGNVVIRSLAAQPNIPAGVVWAGAVFTYDDFAEYGIDDNSYRPPSGDSPRRQRRQELFETHGEFSSENTFWQLVAPTNYLPDLEGAIQLHHANNDPTTSIEYSRNFAEILENLDVQYEFHEYTSGGHDIEGSAFSQAMKNTVTFFKQYL